MKRFFLAVILATTLSLTSCQFEDSDILTPPDDICLTMDDVKFMEYCYQNFDVNKDGKVSPVEAEAVRNINIWRMDIYSIKGIEYFKILETLDAAETPLTNVDLSLNNKLIDFSFYTCSELESVILPSNITSIDGNTFKECISLTSITIPDGVTSIGSWAFSRCVSLTNVTIGNSVTKIGEGAFNGCSLTSLYCKPTIPPTTSDYIFTSKAPDFKIYVPHNSVDAYKTAKGWKQCAEYIVGYDF